MTKNLTERSMRLHRWTLAGTTVLLGTFIPLVFLELLLWMLPVYESPRALPVNEENPIARFEPNRKFIWSRDWDFSVVNKVKTNNFGFVSDFDYDENVTSPLLAIIGDSFVSAFMVPFQQACTGRLARMLSPIVRVYSFGKPGSPLSQYLAYAKFARDTFRPDGMVFVVVGNDYDESFSKHKSGGPLFRPGFHYFVERSNGDLALERMDFDPSFLYRTIRASALGRYLVANFQVRVRVRELGSIFTRKREQQKKRQRFVGNTSASTEPARVADSKRVVDKFLTMLLELSGLQPGRIVFAVDGMRPHLYTADGLRLAEGSYFDVMRRYFMEHAIMREYEVIDMQTLFVAHYKKHQERFEWPQDGHWNSLGHEVCADALARSAVVSEIGQLQTTSVGRKGRMR